VPCESYFSPSVVILVIEVNYFSIVSVDPECHPPVPRDREAPRTLAISGELMNFPARNVLELLRVFHLLQESHDVADLLDNRRRETRSIITLNKPPQSPMDDISDLHWARLAGRVRSVKSHFTGQGLGSPISRQVK